ncbi:MAG: DUF2220 family protein [Eubacteriales bacterium]|nr:DUF2220 family protein [Eubacteriales bacterium]
MKNYRKIIANALLESYEKSLLFSGKNQRSQSIYFRFSKKTVPEYFEDTSVAYDEIHQELQVLENMDLIRIHWRNNKTGHIVDKVSLRLEALESAYAIAGRKKLQSEQDAFKEYLQQCDAGSEVIENFIDWLEDRIDNGLSIKAYADMGDLEGFRSLVRGAQAVVNNKEECFIRELSMRLYGDSKKLEGLKRKIENIIVNFSSDKERFAHIEDVFLEFNVLKNPSVVMIKGDMALLTGKGRIPLKDFQYGIGISSKDIHHIDFDGDASVEKIITIENLTTFYRVREESALVIYLGGFHNEARRNLIWKAHQAFLKARLVHWGDIDIGGFKIYFDLCRKTKLPFEPMNMGISTLEKYRSYTKTLTKNDEAELEKLLNVNWEISDDVTLEIMETLMWMRKNKRKLEQEIVSLPGESMEASREEL